MGCGASRGDPGMVSNTAHPEFVNVNAAWDKAWKTTGVKKGTKIKVKNLVVKRSGWKTIRIFVSSTFRDFHQEREVLIKKVFPDLRLWCEAHRLRLIECDLRWGVPKDVTTEGTLRACLGEIDRCYHDNVMPFFINMTSERVGWVPSAEEVPDAVSQQYKWVEGLSVTEMEILHAAYRIDNPNAMFMLRDPSFLETVPEEYQKAFVESNPVAPVKLEMLKKMTHERFPPGRIHKYSAQFIGFNPDTNLVELGGLEEFAKKVYDFFKERIEAQYPLHDDSKSSPYEHMAEQHESFMKNKAECVFGREAITTKIDEYICSPGADVPYLLVGGAGSGKSSIMARVAEETTLKAFNKQIPGARGKDWTVFYHFVGAVPGSTDLEKTLKRLLLEMKVCNESKMPKDLEDAAHMTCGALNNPNTKPTIVFIDALNQFDSDNMAEVLNWVPRKLAPQVRCIFSMIPDTPHHTAFLKREPMPKVLEVTPLDLETRQTIVTEMLGKYNKRLDEEQMECLLSKSSSSNPLWLSIAVEELRVFGQFRRILDKINQLADGLLELEIQIIERFEQESGQNLLVATLCLMEASGHGLLETELLSLLADEEHLTMPDHDKDADTEKGETGAEKNPKRFEANLPAQKWAEVYRNLKPFLRPFGESGEGRLDFYHRSLSKAVRRKYFKDEEGNERPEVYNWWHSKLAAFFEATRDFARQVEEYPVHLVAIKDNARLEQFLTRWEVFEALFDEEYSSRLVNLWRISVGFDRMEECYMAELKNYINSGTHSKDQINKQTIIIAKFLIQAGRLKAADNLLKKSLQAEEEELGARPQRLVDLYQTIAKNMDEMQKLEGYFDASQVPMVQSIIDHFMKTIEIRKTLDGETNKRAIGNCLNRLSFYYSELQISGQHSLINAEEANRKAKDHIEEAITIFKELSDEAQVADCLITKGVSYDRGDPEQLKCYKNAEEMLLRTVGEICHSMTRVYLNIGVYHEDNMDYSQAFQYFYKWYQLIVELYGKEHTRSIRAIDTLREPIYARYCRRDGLDIPELPQCKDD